MGQPIGSAADIDEDDLLNELEVRTRVVFAARLVWPEMLLLHA